MKKLLYCLAVVVAVAVVVSCDKDRPEPEPDTDTHIVEYCVITNSLESGITIDIHNGGSVKIEPGEEMKIDIGEYTIPLGMADSRDRVVLHADMIVRGEVVHESVWWADVYWDIVREDGEDKYHYFRRYSLNVTDELLEKIETTTVEAKTVKTRAIENPDYEIIRSLGFSTDDIIETDNLYIVEGDVVFEKSSMRNYSGKTRQLYLSVISYPKITDIKVYISPELQTNEGGGATWYQAAVDAIAEWSNISGCAIRYTTVASEASADVVVIRSSTIGGGTIALAFYPSGGNPGISVRVGFNFDYFSAAEKKYVMVHEFGHNLGFAHMNESGIQIPGTPTLDPQSVMATTNTGGRSWNDNGFTGNYDGFTPNDIKAALTLYGVPPTTPSLVSSGSLLSATEASWAGFYAGEPVYWITPTATSATVTVDSGANFDSSATYEWRFDPRLSVRYSMPYYIGFYIPALGSGAYPRRASYRVECRASKNGQYSAWSSLGLFVSDAKPTGPYRLTEEESLGVDSLKTTPPPVDVRR